jgi:hypothetical protein
MTLLQLRRQMAARFGDDLDEPLALAGGNGMTETIQVTATVGLLGDGGAVFEELNSWYHAPPHLEAVLRTAHETRREVKLTTDRDCNIHAVELLPTPPSTLARLIKWARGF